MALTEEMLAIAQQVRPQDCCLVPERREEITTEGGLDVTRERERLRAACAQLQQAGIRVALFIDPEPAQIEAAAQAGAAAVELHTGSYALARGAAAATEFERLRAGARLAARLGLEVHAGHGLNYHNVQPIAALAEVSELNIGHAIIGHALLVGLPEAIRQMKALMHGARA
jgi:pyridoxine 5-phosphate synthase